MSKKNSKNYNNKSNKKVQKEKIEKELDVSKEEVKKDKELDLENTIKLDLDNYVNDSSNKKNNKKNSYLVVILSIILFIVGIFYFINNLFFNNTDSNNLFILINSLLLILFTICFVILSLSNNKRLIGFSSLLLIIYFSFNSLINMGLISFNTFNKVDDFSNMNLSEVIGWASKNKITISEEYEYSDMVDEYKIISQSIKAGTNIKDVNEIKVAVSDGPNPSKSIVVPNMITWNSDRVINFVIENHLSNVNVDFVSSESMADTVIEQSFTGNMNRDEELNLTFSYGEELGYDEYKVINFKNMSSFEAMFYCKQHHLNYEFVEGYSGKIKKGYVYKQSIKANEMMMVDGDPITIYISKGPKIKIPDFKNYNLEKITDWVIKNRLKIKISDCYDDSIKENNIISTNYNKGDIVSQGDTIEVIISRGPLKMRNFKSLDEFRNWADKYNIKYEIQSEFSNSVNVGEVISYSYKKGEIIKNDDTIIVKVSDGKKIEVPNLKGLTKNEAINKLKNVGLNYNFVNKSSDSIPEGKVISQSMTAGSQVSKGSTITVTISSGKEKVQKKENATKNNNSNSSNNNNNSNTSNNSNNNTTPNTPPPTPSCQTYTLGGGLNNIFAEPSGFDSVRSELYDFFTKNYPGVKINVVGENDAGVSGGYVRGIGPGSTVSTCGGPYTIVIAK